MSEPIELIAALNCYRSRVLVELARNGGLVFTDWLRATADRMAENQDEPTISAEAWNEAMYTIAECLSDQSRPWLREVQVREVLDAVEMGLSADEGDDEQDSRAINEFLVAQLGERGVRRLLADLGAINKGGRDA